MILSSLMWCQITVGVNYFGAFYLTKLLLETVKASAPSRVVWVSSPEESLGDIDWEDLECAARPCILVSVDCIPPNTVLSQQ